MFFKMSLTFLILFYCTTQILTQLSESNEVGFYCDLSYLTAFCKLNNHEFKLDAYESTLSDKLFEENKLDFFQHSKWVSFGIPFLIKDSSRMFHFSLEGFYANVRLPSTREREILSEKATKKYGYRINNFSFEHFKCRMTLPQNDIEKLSEKLVIFGRVYHFNRSPLHLKFHAPRNSVKRIKFDEILLTNRVNEIKLDCEVKVKDNIVENSREKKEFIFYIKSDNLESYDLHFGK